MDVESASSQVGLSRLSPLVLLLVFEVLAPALRASWVGVAIAEAAKRAVRTALRDIVVCVALSGWMVALSLWFGR